jgi:hypothetical protein
LDTLIALGAGLALGAGIPLGPLYPGGAYWSLRAGALKLLGDLFNFLLLLGSETGFALAAGQSAGSERAE